MKWNSHIIYFPTLIAQTVKNLPAMQGIWVRYLGQEDHLEKGKATHSSILAWRILWSLMGYSPWGHKELTEQLTLSYQRTTVSQEKYTSVIVWTAN